jgi:Rieske [2Fe-2S] domain
MGNEVIQNVKGDLHCPVHVWNFDTTGKCTNVSNRQLEKYPVEKDENDFFILVDDKVPQGINLDHELSLTDTISFKLVAHACLEIKVGDEVIYTDPWL